MPSTSDTKPVNTAAKGGDHDRVVMLSLKADGSPDQHDPEVIGDKDSAIAATKVQFEQQAVSAADVEQRGVTAPGTDTEGSGVQDPTVEEITKAHEAAAKPAQSQAQSVVNSLHKG